MFDGCFSWNSRYTYVGEKKVHQIPAKWNAYLMRLGPLNKSKDLGFLPVERMGSDNLPLGPTRQTTPHVSGLDDIQNLSVLPPSISRFTFLYSMEDMWWYLPWVWICCLSTWGAKKLRLERLKDWWPNSCWHCKICQSSPGLCNIDLVPDSSLLSVQLLLSWSVKVVTVCCRMLVELVPVVVVLLAKVENRV